MPDYNVLHTGFHNIDISRDLVEAIEVGQGDTISYITDLISDMLSKDENRLFGIQRDSTEVVANVLKIIADKDEFPAAALSIASRLLVVEKAIQEQVKGIAEIQKGSLIQSLIKTEDKHFYLLAKIEYIDYLDRNDLTKRSGLPFRKRVFKTCLIEIIDEAEIGYIYIHDSIPTMSAYWWCDFLELAKLNTDEQNTERAFDAVESYLSKNVKPKSNADYFHLRNSLVGYFKNQVNFSIDNMIDTVIGRYQPDEPTELNMNTIKEDIKKLPEKKKFDPRFEIVPKVIKARIKRTYEVNRNIYLNLTDHIEGYHDIIESGEEDDGKKFIKIRTDNNEIYETFKLRR